jgi:hypothetical protein
VLPAGTSEPSARTAQLEMVVLPVLTANRKRPSCVISTQHGAVCASASGEPPMELRASRSRR